MSSTIRNEIRKMIDKATSKGLRVKVTHQQFDNLTPVRIYADGRIRHATIHKDSERALKDKHAYAREARGLTIVRVLDGRRIAYRGVAICGKSDKFNKNVGTARALAHAVKSIQD